jgi:glycosidase
MGMIFVATTRGIPQIFYGTEILKSNPGTDKHGVIRSDFPGGWEGDEKNGFTGEGLSKKEKAAQEFVKKLLNWRKGEKVIHTGDLTHYIPEDGLYVYFRHNEEKTIMVAMNKNPEQAKGIDMKRFQESLNGMSSGMNVLTNEEIENLEQLQVAPKSAVIIELKK